MPPEKSEQIFLLSEYASGGLSEHLRWTQEQAMKLLEKLSLRGGYASPKTDNVLERIQNESKD